MTKDEIIQMAKQAGFERLGHTAEDWVCHLEDIEEFTKLVADKEREACATIVDEVIDFWVKAGYPECAEVRESMNISEAIRARGQE